MNKIIYSFILFISLLQLSCKKDDKLPVVENLDLIKDAKTNTIIRPIPNEVLEKLDDSLKLYYSKLNNYEIWYNDENRTDLINEIKFCHKDGLNANDYEFDKIKELESKRDKMDDREIIDYDILLTKNYRKIATHLYKGKLKPTELYKDWDLTKKELPLSDSLANAIKNIRVSSSLKNLKPKDFMYKRIKRSLVLLEEYPEYHFNKIEIKDKIQLNDTTPVLVSIKKRLKYWKDYTKTDSIITPVYDSTTFVAVKKFQKRHGLKPDGVIGKGTIKALNFSKNERRAQIIANLERWKWFPYDFGKEYILVNLPDYSLNFVKNNDTIENHTVVVGKSSRRTPVLTSKISNLVFNPTWTVPPTIIKEDLTPSASKNRNYFDRNKISIYDKAGNIVSPEFWEPENSKSYRYVQSPSYNNSLGLVKFNFNNRHMVYLHDTNHRDYFSREYKALSSGCVRVENPLKLSETILKLNDEKWKKSEIDTILNRKNTKTIPIKNSINVLLLYWTNWSEGDQLVFRDDIYDLDKKLYDSLGN
ncbi:MAG: L,D-transpeptidase family protein [Flavobacteriaceae bacterium]|nr:L,D-transpeptidase family protein [Flavobacteriaceae bacterium]